VIASCGTLGLDYTRASLSEFLEGAEAYAEASKGEGGKPEPASPEFTAWMKERFRGGG